MFLSFSEGNSRDERQWDMIIRRHSFSRMKRRHEDRRVGQSKADERSKRARVELSPKPLPRPRPGYFWVSLLTPPQPPAEAFSTMIPDLWTVLFKHAITVKDDNEENRIFEDQYVARLLSMVNTSLEITMKKYVNKDEKPRWWFWIGGHRVNMAKDKEILLQGNLVLLSTTVFDDARYFAKACEDGRHHFLDGAITFGNLETVKIMYKSILPGFRHSCVVLAAKYGRVEVLELLAPSTDWYYMHSCFKTAAEHNQLATCRWLLANNHLPRNTDDKEDVLVSAARGGHGALCEWLIGEAHIRPSTTVEKTAAERGHIHILNLLATFDDFEFKAAIHASTPLLVWYWYYNHHLLAFDKHAYSLTSSTLRCDRTGKRIQWLAAHGLLETNVSIADAIYAGATCDELDQFEAYGFETGGWSLLSQTLTEKADKGAFTWCLERYEPVADRRWEHLLLQAVPRYHMAAVKTLRERDVAWPKDGVYAPRDIFMSEHRDFLRYLIEEGCPLIRC
jgi:hypothetical protein